MKVFIVYCHPSYDMNFKTDMSEEARSENITLHLSKAYEMGIKF